MKKILCLILSLALLLGVLAPAMAFADGSYTEKELKLYALSESDPDTILVRFYDVMPSVPYIGIAQYKKLISDETITAAADGEKVTLTAEDGSSVVADRAAGTLSSMNWDEFRNDEAGMLAGKVVGFGDFDTPFCKIEAIEYEPQPGPVVFDLSAYGIPLYADDKDVYLPLATVNDLLIDGAFNRLGYDGKNVCLLRDYYDRGLQADPDYFWRFVEGAPREADMIDFAYRELCFNMENLYGCPGTSILDPILKEKGLDRALLELDEITVWARDCLLSEDPTAYLVGLYALVYFTYDRHTLLYDPYAVNALPEEKLAAFNEALRPVVSALKEKDYYPIIVKNTSRDPSVDEQRQEVFPDGESYHELGDTAMIAINNFMDYDKEGWKAYYAGTGPMPDGRETPDMIATLLDGLKRAKANPEIKNVILDLSTNTGGSNNLMMTLLAQIIGESRIPIRDENNGRRGTIRYAADSLFDGSFDTAAAFNAQDFHFAILTSRTSFSCGNATPSIARDAGVPILGERSGGGTCMVRSMILPEGPELSVSACFGTLINAAGEPIEAGVPVDAELVTVLEDGSKDYTGMYDLARLSDIMAELTAEKLPNAA